MGLSRHEVNLRRLLVKCELLIKNKQQDDVRFPKYISSLCDMLEELKQTTDSDNINDYTRRINILKDLTFDEKAIEEEQWENICSRNKLLETDNNVRLRTSKEINDLEEVFDYHQSMHDKIAEEMLSLTRNLKEQSKLANRIIKKDTEIASESANLTEMNFSKLKVESDKLTEHSKRACKCWMWVMLVIVMVLFINMVLFMKVMKKKV